MSQTLLREHVKLAIQRAKTYTDAKDVEFSEAIIEALEEIAAAKISKVNGATSGNIPTFDANGNLSDASGIRPITSAEMTAIMTSIFGGNS